MARRAQGLPIGLIPEQPVITAMGDDVVNHGRRGTAAGPCADRVALKEGSTGFAPAAVVAALGSVGALCVMSAISGACRNACAFARVAMGNGLAAFADVWRAGH